MSEPREPGFYCVRAAGEWTIGRWHGDHWDVLGWCEHTWQDGDLDTIGAQVEM